MTSLCGALALVACNNNGGGMDAGHDSGSMHMDLGPGVDMGTPTDGGHDSGPIMDGSMPDGTVGPTCPTGVCNIADGTGCPTGQGCQFIGSPPALSCQPSGTGMVGGHCTTVSDCAEGFTCDPVMMQCEHYCCTLGSTAECPAGQSCHVQITDGMPPTPTGVLLCANIDDGCDVIAMTGCTTAGYGCYPGMSGTTCAMAGMGADGSSCMYVNDCAPGLSCFGSATSGMCRHVCHLTPPDGGTSGCPTGQTCGMVGGSFPAGLGACG